MNKNVYKSSVKVRYIRMPSKISLLFSTIKINTFPPYLGISQIIAKTCSDLIPFFNTYHRTDL